MMVVRLHLTARQHRHLAQHAERRASREFMRAAERPGKLAELMASEIYALEERVQQLTPSVREEVLRQAAVAREGEVREEAKRLAMKARHRALREQLGSAGP